MTWARSRRRWRRAARSSASATKTIRRSARASRRRLRATGGAPRPRRPFCIARSRRLGLWAGHGWSLRAAGRVRLRGPAWAEKSDPPAGPWHHPISRHGPSTLVSTSTTRPESQASPTPLLSDEETPDERTEPQRGNIGGQPLTMLLHGTTAAEAGLVNPTKVRATVARVMATSFRMMSTSSGVVGRWPARCP